MTFFPSTTSTTSSSFSSDELLTPRSITESRVLEALLLHITHDDELFELQCCIKPEPMSQTRQSPSGQHEDVVEDAVETIKVGLKNCIQVMFKYASFPFVQEG